MNEQPAVYFKGLHGLRFFAAFFVIIAHASTFITTSSHPNITDFRGWSLFDNGSRAVDFFFVLSGFLITSLLLQEHRSTGTISVKKFYIRRILRIWPLYYLVICIAFAIFPFLSAVFDLSADPGLGWPQLLLFLFMLPNTTFMFGPQVLLSPLWSIGVEEQFYLLIAPVIKFRKKRLAAIFFAVIVSKLILNLLADHFFAGTHVRSFLLGLRFEVISIGCLGALLLQSRYKRLLQPLFGYAMQALMFCILFSALFFNKELEHSSNSIVAALSFLLFSSIYNGVLMGIIFLYVLLCVSVNNKSFLNTEGKVLNKLGNISYGMYMFHVMTSFVVAAVMKHFFLHVSTWMATVMYYVLCVAGTMAVAFLSYTFFERRFLLLKKRFEQPHV